MSSKDYNMNVFDTFEKKYKRALDEVFDDISREIINEARQNLSSRSYKGIPYKPTMFPSVSTGKMQSSFRLQRTGDKSVVFTFVDYGRTQNYGASIKITPKMKKFFWAKYYETKDTRWKNLALTKKSTIEVPARPFIKDVDITRITAVAVRNKIKQL